MIFDSGVFDQDLIEDYLTHFTLDAILQEIQKPASFQVGAFFGDTHTQSLQVDARIFKPTASFLVDTVFILAKDDPRFQESIINAILWSYGRTIEDLSEAISIMGLRLQLPYATSDDLDLYWATMLGLKRRYNESDEDFRTRLSTRLAIMKSSGTKPECEAILNHALGMRDAVDLQTYWPGDVRVVWKSYAAMRQAQAKYAMVQELLNTMLAAGVSWSTAFPYIEQSVDVFLSGKHSWPFQVDTGLSKEKEALQLVRTEFFNQGQASQDVDANLETWNTASLQVQTLLIARNSMLIQADAMAEARVPKDMLVDSMLRQDRAKAQQVDAIAEAAKQDAYQVDYLSEATRRGFMQVVTELAA